MDSSQAAGKLREYVSGKSRARNDDVEKWFCTIEATLDCVLAPGETIDLVNKLQELKTDETITKEECRRAIAKIPGIKDYLTLDKEAAKST